ncbi:MAG: PQQ-like beta-propeller repeat protein [Anaerolineaceae bacterium]|nr:PQQ-like beta-propeller repeat protein [Anaerolineaceae bacterium]
MKSNKKIYLLLFTVLVGSLLLSACAGGGMLAGSSWPGVTADEDGQIYAAYKNEVLAISSTNGSLVWTYPAKAEASQMFYGQPAVYDDLVIAGAYNKILHAINKQNGNVSWTFEGAEGKYISGILVDADTIYAPNGDHNLYALDSSGKELWTFETGNALWATPAFDEKALYQPSMDHKLYAINRQTGNEIWAVELDGASIFSPALVDEVLYVGTIDGSFYAIDARNGRINWQTKGEAALWSTPVVLNGKVFFGDLDGNIFAYDAQTGNPVWEVSIEGSIVGGAVAYEGGMVFPTETGDLVAINEEGIKQWTRSVPGEKAKIMGTPVVVGDKLVFGVVDGEGLLYAFDFNGNQVWEYTVK